MIRPEAKFRIGEAVMIRSKIRPEMNTDFAVVIKRDFTDGFNVVNGDYIAHVWAYKTNVDREADFWSEQSLRPIPKEEPNGIDASEYIKSLTGIEAQLAEVVS